MRVVDWASDGDVSGTSINDDYNKYIIERGKLIGKTRSLRTKREDTIKSDTLKDNKCISLSEVYTYAEEGKFIFLEKYAMYPNVVRYWLSFYLNGRRASKSPVFSKCLHILNLIPKLIGTSFWLGGTILLKRRSIEKRLNLCWIVYIIMPLVSSRLFQNSSS